MPRAYADHARRRSDVAPARRTSDATMLDGAATMLDGAMYRLSSCQPMPASSDAKPSYQPMPASSDAKPCISVLLVDSSGAPAKYARPAVAVITKSIFL